MWSADEGRRVVGRDGVARQAAPSEVGVPEATAGRDRLGDGGVPRRTTMRGRTVLLVGAVVGLLAVGGGVALAASGLAIAGVLLVREAETAPRH